MAELDPLVTMTAARDLYVEPARFRVVHGDARTTLFRQPPLAFDAVITDAFHDIAIPYHLVTLEYVQLAKSKMNPDGIFVTNVVDAFPDPRMVKSLMKTFGQVFAHVDVWLDRIPQRPERMTYVISASDREIVDDVLESTRGFRRSWLRINDPLSRSGTPLAELPVFSDDFVPVERMISDLLLTREGT